MVLNEMADSKQQILKELVALSHWLGDEARDLVIIGEGNTSARLDENTFLVKASGTNLGTIDASGFVEIDLARVLQLLDGDVSDDDVTRVLMDSRVRPDQTARPSVETPLHGVLYKLTDAQFIGHTHPVAANQILCSTRAEEIVHNIFPDGVVVLGPYMVFVPYTDPGVMLTREVFNRVTAALQAHGEQPRVIWLQNHGVFALGQTARQVQNITQMAVKHARVLSGVLALGEAHRLSPHDVARLHTRPDEEVRRVKFK